MFCSNCHTDIDPAKWTLHEAYCERHNYFCAKCTQVIRKNEHTKHDEELHTMIECSCGEEIEKTLYAEHQQKTCANRLVSCLYCEYPLQFYALIKHEEECGSRTEKCEYCGEWVQARKANGHVCVPLQPPLPQELPPQELSSDEIGVCPFCVNPFTDYVALQEHIFGEHPEQIV